MRREPRLPPVLRSELAGVDWHWECGTKHWKLMVNGQLAGIWPKGKKGLNTYDLRPVTNTRAQIRRILQRESA